MRITIKSYLADYIHEVGSQLGIEDATEVVSIILLDHKRGLCNGSQRRVEATKAPEPVQDANERLADGLEDLLNSASY